MRRPERNDPTQKRRGGRSRRPVATRTRRRRFLIICEGAKTEPNYFLGFRVPREVAEIIGAGDNTLSLVRQAILKRDQFRDQGNEFEEVWCVFDRDSFPPQQFNAAIALAHQEGMHVAYSNEAFELWYVLHFGFHQSAWTRQQLIERLKTTLPGGYAKNQEDIFDLLLPIQEDAMRNAQRLLALYSPDHNPESDNPSTTVHVLVARLRENSPHW